MPHLAHIKRYRDFYQSRSSKDYIILDNGVAEGIEFGTKHLFTIAEHLGAHEIVVPDCMGDTEESISKALAFSRYAIPDYRYMAVVQGTTLTEMIKCLHAYLEMSNLHYITTIGIPRILANTIDPKARARLLEYIEAEGLDMAMEYHALGATKELAEVKYLSTFKSLRGIDTSTPIHMGLKNISFSQKVPPRPEDFFDIQKSTDQLDRNIKTYLKWCRYTGQEDSIDKP